MATPQFILDLREKIGHDPLWLIGVTAIVEDAEGRLLLGRRADTGEWAPVYGINEPGEEPAVTACREVLEECGVACVPRALVGVSAGDAEVVYANGDRCRYLDIMFLCGLAEGASSEAFVGDEESLEVGWFEPDALPEPLARNARERLGRLAEFRRGGGVAAIFSF